MKSFLILLFLIFITNVYATNSTNNNERIFFDTYLETDIITIFLVFFISIITTIGGVGGGGMLIPTYMLVSKFSLEEAIPLSVVTILGDTLVRVLVLYNKRHPLNEKRYLIDMMPILLIVPFDGNSSFIGVILSQITPQSLTIILIILVLGFTFYKSISKAIRSFLKENIYLNQENNNLEMVMIDGIAEYFDAEQVREARLNNLGEGDTLKDKIIKTGIIFTSILIISIFSITRSLLDKCGLYYWIHIISQFFIVAIMGFLIIKYLANDYEKKRQNNYIFLQGDIIWKKENITKFILIATVTGALSTYMGIGGGMLITPIMMQVGMIPEVVVATSSITTFFSSIISTINYILVGKLLINYGMLYSFVSAIGSIFGLILSNMMLSRFKRQSIIIFIVSLILFTSIILLVTNALTNNDLSEFKFNNFCES
jgi:uncharacterized membrane protein YfcA